MGQRDNQHGPYFVDEDSETPQERMGSHLGRGPSQSPPRAAVSPAEAHTLMAVPVLLTLPSPDSLGLGGLMMSKCEVL